MGTMKKGKKILCVMVLAALAASGCGSSGEKKKNEDVFRVGVPHLMTTYGAPPDDHLRPHKRL